MTEDRNHGERIVALEERNRHLKERLDKMDTRLWLAVAGILAAVIDRAMSLIGSGIGP